MDLAPDIFNDSIEQAGQRMWWRQAYLCPCRNPDSGAASPTCPVCRKKGVFWGKPGEVTAAVAGQRVQRAWAQMGMYETGDVVLSVPGDSPLYNAHESDRVLLTDSTEPFQSVLTRTTTQESLGFGVESIDRVFWLDANKSIVEGQPEIDSDGNVTWPNEPAPAAGVQYSLSGRKRPEYFIFGDIPGDRAHFGGLRLPRKMALRRFDLFAKN
jgi:hypothetical protein